MHYGEDELTLYFYGEGRNRAAIERHLDRCEDCVSTYQSLAATLNALSAYQIPSRDSSYPDQVWQRLAPRLPDQDRAPLFQWPAWRPAVAAVAALLVAVVAFTLGRSWSGRTADTSSPSVINGVGWDGSADAIAERIRLAAVADHLDRSERVLLDLTNADPQGAEVDLTAEQQWAAELIDANRLYRDAASRAGDALVAGVLDDLERTLLDVTHGPSKPTEPEFSDLRGRLNNTAVLFKVRVLAGELRERESAPISVRKTT